MQTIKRFQELPEANIERRGQPTTSCKLRMLSKQLWIWRRGLGLVESCSIYVYSWLALVVDEKNIWCISKTSKIFVALICCVWHGRQRYSVLCTIFVDAEKLFAASSKETLFLPTSTIHWWEVACGVYRNQIVRREKNIVVTDEWFCGLRYVRLVWTKVKAGILEMMKNAKVLQPLGGKRDYWYAKAEERRQRAPGL